MTQLWFTIRDFDQWWSKSGGSSPVQSRLPSRATSAALNMHDNAAFRRTGSGVDDVDPSHVAKLAIKKASTGADTEGDRASKPDMGSAGPKRMPTHIPTHPVGVDVYHMGQYTYRGVSDKVLLCQVFPASLSERKQEYTDSTLHGKAVCSKKDDSLALAVRVMLPDVLHLPLSAEPPLCINMVVPSLASSTLGRQQMSMTRPRSHGSHSGRH